MMAKHILKKKGWFVNIVSPVDSWRPISASTDVCIFKRGQNIHGKYNVT